MAFFDLDMPTSGGFCFLFKAGEFLEGPTPCPTSSSSCSRIVGEGSLLARRDGLVVTDLAYDAVGSLPILEEDLGIDWQSNVARLTPVDNRRDLAFGLGGERGGERILGGSGAGLSAKSILVKRFEALTGGEEVGAGRWGVSAVFFFGSRTFAGGGLGFGTGTGTDFASPSGREKAVDVESGRGVMGSIARAGVLGKVTPDEMGGGGSDSKEIVTVFEGCALNPPEVWRAVAFAVLAHKGGGLIGDGSSICTGLEALHAVGR